MSNSLKNYLHGEKVPEYTGKKGFGYIVIGV